MAVRKRKIRRATLRGWWKPLPFLLLPFCTLFLFAALEGRRLQTEYDIIKLITQIRAINIDIAHLKDERRELNRIELMDEQAPSLDLIEPNPEQRKIISEAVVRKAMKIVESHTESAISAPAPQRTVLYDLTPMEERMVRAKDE
ncbi:MAG: hypothetical protein COA73_08580 [Candidatus Hydrogenedentota bacterium]|nr:MAG: hypothetical protein COA73_08580 [Candidatus Hydrogenedentota bacterium]